MIRVFIALFRFFLFAVMRAATGLFRHFYQAQRVLIVESAMIHVRII